MFKTIFSVHNKVLGALPLECSNDYKAG